MLIILLFFLYVDTSTQSMFTHGSYKAAVVEYSPTREPFHTPSDVLKHNSEEYVKFIQNAARKGAEIIAFPEYGLTSSAIVYEHRDIFAEYSIEVPDPSHNPNPCINESLHKVLRLISCAAKDEKIYVVINIVEKHREYDGWDFYNTNLVFNRNGTIIKRVRKINTYMEPHVKEGNELETFTTDFGVTFGTFICFDLLYKRPAIEILKERNVSDIIFTSAWISEMPYLHALSIQAGYARAAGVNLLAAGLNNPASKEGGSGIYLFDGRIAEIYISPARSSKLIVQSVPKTRIKLSAIKCNNNSHVMPRFRLGGNLNTGSLSALTENMTEHTMLALSSSQLETRATLCNYNGKYCCKFNVVLDELLTSSDPKYKLALFYGVREVGGATIGIRSCSLVACQNKHRSSCGKRTNNPNGFPKFKKIAIKGIFQESDDTFDQPVTLTHDLIPMTEYTYCETLSDDKRTVQVDMVATQQLSNILSFGIFGRMYEYDGLRVGLLTDAASVFGGSSKLMLILMLVMVIISLNSINLIEALHAIDN